MATFATEMAATAASVEGSCDRTVVRAKDRKNLRDVHAFWSAMHPIYHANRDEIEAARQCAAEALRRLQEVKRSPIYPFVQSKS